MSLCITSMSTLISTDGIILVHNKDRDRFKSLLVPGEAAQVVPTHRVDIRLPNLLSEHRVMSRQEAVQVLVPKKRLLLNYLSVDVRRSQGLDLRDEEVSNSFYGLKMFQHPAH